MPTDSEDIAQYFSSLNGLTKKLSVAVQSGEEWLQSSDEPGSESLLEILKIKSGEKIVVDFENEDGWTWRDEHSGPFSWMTRSQQDLSVWDDNDDVDCGASDTTSGTKTTKQEFIPKKRVSQQFSVPLGGDDVAGGLSEIEAAFQKFGLSQVTSSGTENSSNHCDTSVTKPDENVEPDVIKASSDLSLHSNRSENNDISQTNDALSCNTSETMSPKTEHTAFFVTAESERSFSADVTPVHKPYPTGKDRGQIEAEEESLIASVQEPVHVYKDTGHLSPAFEFDPLDSFSEPPPSVDSLREPHVATEDIGGYDNLATVNDASFDEEQKKPEEDNVNVVVSGFDFLDNW